VLVAGGLMAVWGERQIHGDPNESARIRTRPNTDGLSPRPSTLARQFDLVVLVLDHFDIHSI